VEAVGEHEYQVSVVYTVGESLPISVNIVAAVNELLSDGVSVRVSGDMIIATKSTPFAVALYNISGAMIYEGDGRSTYTISVPAGFYLLKADGVTTKVRVN